MALAGCPLFGQPDGKAEHGSSSDPAFRVALEGDGVSKTGAFAYRIALPASADTGRALVLAATLDGKRLALMHAPRSSDPAVIRVDGAHALTALAPGRARITVAHGDHRAALVVDVAARMPSGAGFRVVSTALRDAYGPVAAFSTDNYKHGNGGMVDLPRIWATIHGPDGKPIPREQCGLFVGVVTPDTIPSGWPNDDRERGGIVRLGESHGYVGDDETHLPGCGFGFNATGFPIIGNGVQPFRLQIHWTCVGRFELPQCGTPGYPPCAPEPSTAACGSPLPGGVVDFGVHRQGLSDCSYCGAR